MNIWKGNAVCGGIAIGTACVYRRSEDVVEKKYAENKDAEREKYAMVKTLAIDELDKLFKKAKDEIGEEEAQIFSIHKMMVEDEYYNESVLNIIEKQKMNAETAVLMTSSNFEKLFRNIDNAYMRERAGDIRDVSDRIVALLRGKKRLLPVAAKENTILFSSSISPSETMQMDKSKISAFVTEYGSSASHTAILAKSLGIPAVSGIKIRENIDGKRVAIDGYSGIVYIEPDAAVIENLNKKAKEIKHSDKKMKKGQKTRVLATISAPEEVKNETICESDGGIFESENLFCKSDTFPSEDYQFDAYRKVLESAKEVAIRTLDINSEKKGTFFGIFREENAVMGMRSIRLCLKYPQIFKTQLRAVLKASVCGKARILLPMVVSEEEVLTAKKLLDEAKNELRAEKTDFDENIPLGVVIETPASAIISDELAKLCDFFVIDGNNLAQFVLAMDRKNLALSELFDKTHKAVMKMIEITAKNAHKNGIKVGICGDVASEPDKIPELLKMGIDEFAVKPRNVLKVKKTVCENE
ncbi:MAG: phosphoenolpyruvate--protein phosphotransferase [Clostridia bacterium]|nr:phosphoenolpyruvate--protein phosphotransferase [Clostridia bacterium]